MKKILVCALVLGCSSESFNETVGSGGAAGTAGQAGAGTGGSSAGGAAGAGGVGSGSAGGTTSGGGSSGDSGITPACLVSQAVTMEALAKKTWIWTAFSYKNFSTNKCLSCSSSPCAACPIVPIEVNLTKAQPELRAQSTCKALSKTGTCGAEISCNVTYITSLQLIYDAVVPTASGWKMIGLHTQGPWGVANIPEGCNSGIPGNYVWDSMKDDVVATFDGVEFPCP